MPANVTEHDPILAGTNDREAREPFLVQEALCAGSENDQRLVGRIGHRGGLRTYAREGPALVGQAHEMRIRRHDVPCEHLVPPVVGLVVEERVMSQVDPS